MAKVLGKLNVFCTWKSVISGPKPVLVHTYVYVQGSVHVHVHVQGSMHVHVHMSAIIVVANHFPNFISKNMGRSSRGGWGGGHQKLAVERSSKQMSFCCTSSLATWRD